MGNGHRYSLFITLNYYTEYELLLFFVHFNTEASCVVQVVISSLLFKRALSFLIGRSLSH